MSGIRTTLALAAGGFLLLGGAADVEGGAHTWMVEEVFSNADGTIQFIELINATVSCEQAIGGNSVRSDATANTFVFPGNLASCADQKSLLLATAAFAALPGAPAPDYIIPANFFLTNADTIRYVPYNATLAFPSPALPLDGVNSLQRNPATGVVEAGTNAPRNFAGVTGSVDASGPPSEFQRGDASQDGDVGIGDAIQLLGYLFQSEPTTCTIALDANDDGLLNLADAIFLLAYLFQMGAEPPPPFGACGSDPTPGGTLNCIAHNACP